MDLLTAFLIFAILILSVVFIVFLRVFVMPKIFDKVFIIFGDKCVVCNRRHRKIKTALIDGFEFNICHRCYIFIKKSLSEHPEIYNYFNEHIQKSNYINSQKDKGKDIKPELNISDTFKPIDELLNKKKNFKKPVDN